MTVTVKSIKERELPEADDEFAQLASEFDTMARTAGEPHRAGAPGQAHPPGREDPRQRAGDAARDSSRCRCRRPSFRRRSTPALHNAIHGLDHDEDRFAEALEAQGSSREKFDAETREAAEKAVKTQLLMDAIADDLDIQVGQNDLTERLVLMSRQYGIEPQQLLQLLQQQQPAAGGVRRRAPRPDRGRGGRGGHRHRHRRQRGRHQRVLRLAARGGIAEADAAGEDSAEAAEEPRQMLTSRGISRGRVTPTAKERRGGQCVAASGWLGSGSRDIEVLGSSVVSKKAGNRS